MRLINQLNPQPVQQKSGLDFRFILILVIVAVIAATLALFLVGLKPKPFCGNKVCDKDETCISCLSDCPCPSGQYCSQKTNGCATAKCGNSVCEPTEDTSKCCKDCGCYKTGEVCNTAKNKCEAKEFPFSDEETVGLINKYFSDQGKNVTELELIGLFNYQNKLLKSFRGNVDGVYENILVYEDGKVVVAPIS